MLRMSFFLIFEKNGMFLSIELNICRERKCVKNCGKFTQKRFIFYANENAYTFSFSYCKPVNNKNITHLINA